MKKAYLINIEGRVTGVGFRYSTISKVNEFSDISGYVKNIGDGKVETLIQGDEKELIKLIEWLQKGPPLARVDSFSMSEPPYDSTINKFGIR